MEALGLGRVLDPLVATPASIRDVVAAVLADPEYAAAAGAIRSEIQALPPPHDAVRLIEALVSAEGAPE